MAKEKPGLYPEYRAFLLVCLLFVVLAFIFDRPSEIFPGYVRILTSRGLQITDFMYIGGLGATILNSVIVALFALWLLRMMDAKPSGPAIMTFWMSLGWTFYGTTIINILPMTMGVYLYARMKKQPFSNYMIPALLCATIAPIVSVFFVSNPVVANMELELPLVINVLKGIAAGLLCGFILPMVASATARMHDGYTLYNIGVAGGMIAMFLAAVFNSFGINIPTEYYRQTDDNVRVAMFMYIACGILLFMGLFAGRAAKTDHVKNYKALCAQTGRAPNDFYSLFGPTTYINMALMGILGTSTVIALGAYFDGGVVASLFTMIAFGAMGKHLRNVIPLLIGALICAHLVAAPPTSFVIVLSVLLVSCLAPMSGQFGPIWGIVIGFVHVIITYYTGHLTNGLNLYNNGFASGFVALILVPIISNFVKKSKTPAP